MPMFDTKSCKEISERPVLPTPINLKCLYLFIFVKLKFNKNLELLENASDFCLMGNMHVYLVKLSMK